jgi:hypothetical protein
MFPLLGHQQNPPPPPPLNPRQTVVFSLQRTGAGDVVFSYQFPVTAAAVVEPAPAFGGAWPGMYAQPRRSRREIELENAEAERRAAEVSEAAIARASQYPSAEQAGTSAEQAAPSSLLGLLIQMSSSGVSPYPPDRGSNGVGTPLPTPIVTPSPDMDEDAILAATVLLMRRRLTR